MSAATAVRSPALRDAGRLQLSAYRTKKRARAGAVYTPPPRPNHQPELDAPSPLPPALAALLSSRIDRYRRIRPDLVPHIQESARRGAGQLVSSPGSIVSADLSPLQGPPPESPTSPAVPRPLNFDVASPAGSIDAGEAQARAGGVASESAEMLGAVVTDIEAVEELRAIDALSAAATTASLEDLGPAELWDRLVRLGSLQEQSLQVAQGLLRQGGPTMGSSVDRLVSQALEFGASMAAVRERLGPPLHQGPAPGEAQWLSSESLAQIEAASARAHASELAEAQSERERLSQKNTLLQDRIRLLEAERHAAPEVDGSLALQLRRRLSHAERQAEEQAELASALRASVLQAADEQTRLERELGQIRQERDDLLRQGRGPETHEAPSITDYGPEAPSSPPLGEGTQQPGESELERALRMSDASSVALDNQAMPRRLFLSQSEGSVDAPDELERPNLHPSQLQAFRRLHDVHERFAIEEQIRNYAILSKRQGLTYDEYLAMVPYPASAAAAAAGSLEVAAASVSQRGLPLVIRRLFVETRVEDVESHVYARETDNQIDRQLLEAGIQQAFLSGDVDGATPLPAWWVQGRSSDVGGIGWHEEPAPPGSSGPLRPPGPAHGPTSREPGAPWWSPGGIFGFGNNSHHRLQRRFAQHAPMIF
uniref:Uncharacterized protein n=1 Tax=Rhizochromulina marina TaxID=1034831 RepID=A0A7S2WG54_9STRA